MTTLNTSVIVVGGSLVGLSSALFLAHRHVPVVLLERHLTSSPHPRAIGYTARTIEFLRAVGVESRLPEARFFGGPPRRIVVESLAGKWQQEQAWTKGGQKKGKTGSPGAEKPQTGPAPSRLADFSPVEGIATAQDKIEPVLRDGAKQLGADLRLGFQVTDWEQNTDGVTVTAMSKEGQQLHVSGQYMIACDGGKSSIREQLGIQRHGVGHLRDLRSILFRCTPLEEYFNRGYSQFQIQGREDGFEAFMTTYGEGRLALMWNESGDKHMDEATQKDWIRKAAGKEVADEDIELITTGQWETGGYIADSFMRGRVFLAGDAAHTLPPNRGGYGANTGIADAWNLAWKLAAVTSGASRPALLDTYDAERRPVADVRHDQIFIRDDHARFVQDRAWTGRDARVYDDVAMEFGQLYRSAGIVRAHGEEEEGEETLPEAMRPDEWRGQPGTRAPHVSLQTGDEGMAMSTLDLFGASWVVLSEDPVWRGLVMKHGQELGIECSFVQVGEDVREKEEGSWKTAYGVGETGAVLVRPDGHIAWRVEKRPDNASSMFAGILASVSFSTKCSAA